MRSNEPIRILQIGMSSNKGGIETYLMRQFEHVDHDKVMYDFVNNDSNHDMVFSEQLKKNGGKIYRIKSRRSNPLLHYWQWVCLLVKVHKKYQGIVLNASSDLYIFPLLAAVFLRIPLRIMHSHTTGYEIQVGWARKILSRIHRKLLPYCCTHYFACSIKAGKWMYGEKRPFTVIHNAIDSALFRFDRAKRMQVRKKLEIGECQFVMGHVGRFCYPKNHLFLIDIFYTFHEKYPNSILLLIGNGELQFLKKVQDKVSTYKLHDSVLFLGERDDIPDLMQAMDCFVLPSRFEGLPVVGIEAQAAGLLCFFSANITREVGITSSAYFISIESEAKLWAGNIAEHIFDSRKDTKEEIVAAGYDIQQEAKRVEYLYEELLRGKDK